MLSFGFMTLNLQHENEYFTEVARRAKKYQISCYRFIPANINPHSEMIDGELFNDKKEEWVKASFPIPTVLYDRCFYGEDFHSKQCKAIAGWLKSGNKSRFLGYGLPNKLRLYEALKNTMLSPYLPETIAAHHPNVINTYLQERHRLILKPVDGSQGKGIYSIVKQGKKRMVATDKRERQIVKTFEEESSFVHWLERILSKKDYLLQPYLPLVTNDRKPFDVRSLLQKDETGKWVTIGKGVRIGKMDGLLSNLSAGGEILDYETWLKEVEPSSRDFITSEIQDILRNLPMIMEEEFPPLFELGVDIGVAKNQSIWILDINSKPGRKVLLKGQPILKDNLYESPLLYARYLAGKETTYT